MGSSLLKAHLSIRFVYLRKQSAQLWRFSYHGQEINEEECSQRVCPLSFENALFHSKSAFVVGGEMRVFTIFHFSDVGSHHWTV